MKTIPYQPSYARIPSVTLRLGFFQLAYFDIAYLARTNKALTNWRTNERWLPAMTFQLIAQMIFQKNIGCRWYSSVLFLWQPTGHWFSCKMGVCHWSPSVTKTDEDQRQPMFSCNIIWANRSLMNSSPATTACSCSGSGMLCERSQNVINRPTFEVICTDWAQFHMNTRGKEITRRARSTQMRRGWRVR